MDGHYSKNQTSAEIRSCTPYFATALCWSVVAINISTKGTKGNLGVIMMSYIDLVDCLFHYFLFDHAYK